MMPVGAWVVLRVGVQASSVVHQLVPHHNFVVGETSSEFFGHLKVLKAELRSVLDHRTT